MLVSEGVADEMIILHHRESGYVLEIGLKGRLRRMTSSGGLTARAQHAGSASEGSRPATLTQPEGDGGPRTMGRAGRGSTIPPSPSPTKTIMGDRT